MANWFATTPNEVMAGKTAVVMGGGSGIGKATAEALIAAGCNVMICGVPEQLCLDTAEELKAQATTGGVIGMFCDFRAPTLWTSPPSSMTRSSPST